MRLYLGLRSPTNLGPARADSCGAFFCSPRPVLAVRPHFRTCGARHSQRTCGLTKDQRLAPKAEKLPDRRDCLFRALDNALSSGLRQFSPDLICYVAGADPYREDQLGGLALTIEGLKRRDDLVFRVARAKGIPVMVTYAGGYAQRVEDTVTIHCNTVVAAKEVLSASVPS